MASVRQRQKGKRPSLAQGLLGVVQLLSVSLIVCSILCAYDIQTIALNDRNIGVRMYVFVFTPNANLCSDNISDVATLSLK